MKNYYVTLPATMAIEFFVQANSEEEALEKSFEVDFQLDLNNKNVQINEFELHKQVTRGNVCSAVLNDYYIEEK